MPIIQSAKKKLRQDKKRTVINKKVKLNLKDAIKSVTAKATAQSIQTVHKAIDTAKKKKIIHKNKAARLKKYVAQHAKG